MLQMLIGRISMRATAHVIAAVLLCFAGAAAHAAEPIKIGFGMAQTGPLAANGKSALLAMQIWAEDVNAKGGLLGRPVKLVYYDDQSNPSTVPGLYTKLLDVDKVDLVVGGYATNMLAPAMPVIIQHNMVFLGLYGLAVNSEFHYPKYFSVISSGPEPKLAFSEHFFQLAMQQNPKPQTVAIVAADAEFAKNAADGARENIKKAGLKVVYDRSYPPTTTDFTPIVRAIQATNPDIVFVASYPLDSIGMVTAAHEIGLKTKLFGGGMVGLQSTAIKTKLGPMLNGIVNYDFWLPAKTMMYPGAEVFLKKYQARAAAAGVDPLGYYMGPAGYAYLQVLGEAVEGAKTLDQDQIAKYMHEHSFKTVFGDLKFGADGEWTESRVIEIQFQNISGNGLDQFSDMSKQVIVAPTNLESGKLIYPYSPAK